MKEIGSALATLYKVSTQNDGGLRLTLDLPANEHPLAQKLMALISEGDPNVFVAFVKPLDTDNNNFTGLEDLSFQ